MTKKALITGITGQDGSYLADLLVEKGYEVHGIVRRSSMFNRSRIEHLRKNPDVYEKQLFLHYADLQDVTSLRRIFASVEPDEVYHLAGQSHVGLSFEIPESTVQEVAIATLSLLEICLDLPKKPKLFHAASSEIFGTPEQSPQSEETPHRPENPYGCAKSFATSMCRVYRRAHGLFVVSGIAYNHESPRRGENFVTRKIASAAARWKAGERSPIQVGNLDVSRDWGYAPEFVEAMWRMLQQEKAEDYILATGHRCSLRDFIRACFSAIGVELSFEGEGLEERAIDADTGELVLKVSERFFRKVDSANLVGNPAAAERDLGWKAKIKGESLAKVLVEAEEGRLP